jgi:hypothetical protein
LYSAAAALEPIEQNLVMGWHQLDAAFAGKASFDSRGLGTVWDPANHQFLIFGGNVFNTTKFYGDTWTLIGK